MAPTNAGGRVPGLLEALDYTPGRLDQTAPAFIWLQVDSGDAFGDRSIDWPGSEEVTWQDESVGGLEIAYVRADLVEQGEQQAVAPYGWIVSGQGGVQFIPGSARKVMALMDTPLAREIGVSFVEVYTQPQSAGGTGDAVLAHRAQQAIRVMPLIGPFLDAYDHANPDDTIHESGIRPFVAAINAAMEGDVELILSADPAAFGPVAGDAAAKLPAKWRATAKESVTPVRIGALVNCADELEAALGGAYAPPLVLPEGFVLVPRQFGIPADAWEAAAFSFGGPATGEGEAYMDCTAWIGNCADDDGTPHYGLHISRDECPEEGSTTLAEFAAAPVPATGEGT